MPIGSMIAWNNSSSVPEDYLICDGSLFDISKYPKLYQVLKSNKLPDMNNSLKTNINGYYAVGLYHGKSTSSHSGFNRGYWIWGGPEFTRYVETALLGSPYAIRNSSQIYFKSFSDGLSFSWNIKWIIKVK